MIAHKPDLTEGTQRAQREHPLMSREFEQEATESGMRLNEMLELGQIHTGSSLEHTVRGRRGKGEVEWKKTGRVGELADGFVFGEDDIGTDEADGASAG